MKIAVTCRPFMGDIVNTWPALELLKLVIPHATIEFFNKPAFKDVALKCPWVDQFVNIDTRNYKGGYDITIMFNHNGWMIRDWLNVKTHVRVISSDKQLDYPAMILLQLKHLCEKPEYRYNIDLINVLLDKLQIERPPCDTRLTTKKKTSKPLNITIHPTNGLSAPPLSADSYIAVVRSIYLAIRSIKITLTKVGNVDNSPDKIYNELIRDGVDVQIVNANTISELDAVLGNTDVLLVGSTGPLHYASVLGIPTVGFYPNLQYDNLVRWRPPGNAKHVGIVFDKLTQSLDCEKYDTVVSFIRDL